MMATEKTQNRQTEGHPFGKLFALCVLILSVTSFSSAAVASSFNSSMMMKGKTGGNADVSAEEQNIALEDIPVDALLKDENKSADPLDTKDENNKPRPLVELQEIPGYNPGDKKTEMPIDIRAEAQKEAALSYGARGGLAARSYEINKQTDGRSASLDKIFNFRQLLISAPSGFLIEPPIISESLKALLIENDGQKAAVADAIYRINENVKFVSTARDWRQYLDRTWGAVEEPPEILRPKDDKERALWREMVKKGWDEGYSQADEVFEQDLARLTADFDGMVRYRQLLAQGMVSPPFAQQVDRGVTGAPKQEPNTMRVGDRAVVITGVPQLITESSRWQPANR